MSKVRLRQYQVQTIEELEQKLTINQRVVVVLPTGSGKTVVAGAYMHGLREQGKRVLVLAHRHELIDQFYETLAAFNMSHDVHQVAPGGAVRPTHPINLVSIQTMFSKIKNEGIDRRMAQLLQPDYIIIDECHHAPSNSWEKVIRTFPTAKAIGLTATPRRLDGKGLDTLFQSMVNVIDIAALVKQGYLAPMEHKVPKHLVSNLHDVEISATTGDYNRVKLAERVSQKMMADALEAYQEYAAGRRAIFYGINVRHSEGVAQKFRDAGIPSIHIDAKTSRPNRRVAIEAFRDGRIEVLCNVDLISEGFDVPDCEVIIMGRPTQSMTMFRQQAGRAMRPKIGGAAALLLDLVNNFSIHGVPDAPYKWTLRGEEKEQENIVRQRVCQVCAMRFSPHKDKCPRCDAEYITKKRARKPIKTLENGEMVEVTSETTQKTVNLRNEFWRRIHATDYSDKQMMEVIKEFQYAKGMLWQVNKILKQQGKR